MQLQEFFDYKNQLMEDLLTNEDIVRLIDDTVALQNAEPCVHSGFPLRICS